MFETVVVVVAVLTVVTYDQVSQSDKNCEENESHKSQHTLAEFEMLLFGLGQCLLLGFSL